MYLFYVLRPCNGLERLWLDYYKLCLTISIHRTIQTKSSTHETS